MRRPASLFSVVRWLDPRALKPGRSANRLSRRAGLFLAAGLILLSIGISACSDGGSSTQTPTPSTQPLSKSIDGFPR
jgi:hypothetical protein